MLFKAIFSRLIATLLAWMRECVFRFEMRKITNTSLFIHLLQMLAIIIIATSLVGEAYALKIRVKKVGNIIKTVIKPAVVVAATVSDKAGDIAHDVVKKSGDTAGRAVHDVGELVAKVAKASSKDLKKLEKPIKGLAVQINSLSKTLKENEKYIIVAAGLAAGVPPSMLAMYYMQVSMKEPAEPGTDASTEQDDLAYFRYIAEKNGYNPSKVQQCFRGSKGKNTTPKIFSSCMNKYKATIIPGFEVIPEYDEQYTEDIKLITDLQTEVAAIEDKHKQLKIQAKESVTGIRTALKSLKLCKSDEECDAFVEQEAKENAI